MELAMFFWSVVFCVSVFVALLSCAYLYSKRLEKNRQCVAALATVAVALVMFSTFGLIGNMPPDGEANTSFSTNVTYTTEWFSTDGPAVVMKLRVGESEQALYYEIPKDKIIFWGGEENKLPAKFKVLTDKPGEHYALDPVE
jgi:hypothetical protein